MLGSASVLTSPSEEQPTNESGRIDHSTMCEALAQLVVQLAKKLQVRIAVAESCTGGLLAAALTSVPGASAVFNGGVVAYTNDAKTNLLAVSSDLLAAHGAVSGQVAEAMALGVLQIMKADVAVSITGIAGPDGGSPDKPVGLVWLGVATKRSGNEHVESVRNVFSGDRERIRTCATTAAMELLRKKLVSPHG